MKPPVAEDSRQITRLLAAWRGGDQRALDTMVPVVYRELRRIAARLARREAQNHTLQPTALVNEAYLRLVGQAHVAWEDRAHFFAVAARVMRHILVDRARGRHRTKRGGGRAPLPLDEALALAPERSHELLELDDALEQLAAVDARKARVVELRFFGGLTVEETAEVLKVSPNTVIRDWGFARAWLRRAIARRKEHD